MSGHDPNPIVFKNKKIKTRRPEHSLTPRPLHPITSHFCFAERILDAVMKLVPIRFLSILKMQYIIGKVLGITKPCTQLHPPPPSLFQPPPSSFQPPPSSFQPPPSSLQHPQ